MIGDSKILILIIKDFLERQFDKDRQNMQLRESAQNSILGLEISNTSQVVMACRDRSRSVFLRFLRIFR